MNEKRLHRLTASHLLLMVVGGALHCLDLIIEIQPHGFSWLSMLTQCFMMWVSQFSECWFQFSYLLSLILWILVKLGTYWHWIRDKGQEHDFRDCPGKFGTSGNPSTNQSQSPGDYHQTCFQTFRRALVLLLLIVNSDIPRSGIIYHNYYSL